MVSANSHSNYSIVMDYSESIVSGKKIANKETIEMCQRFFKDLKNADYNFDPTDAEGVIKIIETTFVHDKGERFDGTPLRGQPFLLEPWQKFIVYNILGFFLKGTKIRRFKEAFIYLPRKNGKTRFVAALSWALALLGRKSGSTIYIVGASLRQSKQAFDFINFNLKQMGIDDDFRILSNNQESSISGDLGDGSIHIEALASNPDRQDSLNCNIAIADELHAYKSPTQYNVIKEAMKAYTNKLMVGITTAGSNQNSFCYRRLTYCQKILEGSVKDETYFVFIAKADQNERGDVDYTSAVEHEKANPNYGVTIRPEDIMTDALEAQNDPQQRKDFLAKSINIYTSAMNTYFNIDEFKYANKKSEELLGLTGLSVEQKLDKLSKLPVRWYGGADLSLMHDLTATALYGTYKDIDIVIPHAFFPVTAAHQKADDDNIPLFGWMDDGWLTMSNGNVTDYSQVAGWFVAMRDRGFKIVEVGYDRKFGAEFITEMRAQKFKIVDTPQLAILKTSGFRRIERQVKKGQFYYLGSDAYEYCVKNVKGTDRHDGIIYYEKILDDQRIDIFDASVFSCMQMLEHIGTEQRVKNITGRG